MEGVDSFVTNNFIEYDSKFDSCVNAIVYAYSLLEKEQTYSRQQIKDIATEVRGKESNTIELEDFLRNDLVKNYIEPNRTLFGLKHYLFESGVEEFYKNIKIGILDIKVCSPLMNGDTYFIFECKRFNKEISNKYITDGVVRFINEQYYKQTNTSVAGMIAFLEATNTKDKICIDSSFDILKSLLEKHNDSINVISDLEQYNLHCDFDKEVEQYPFVFKSIHKRIIHNLPILITHIMLDYNHLIN